jgi:hypothetical protein
VRPLISLLFPKGWQCAFTFPSRNSTYKSVKIASPPLLHYLYVGWCQWAVPSWEGPTTVLGNHLLSHNMRLVSFVSIALYCTRNLTYQLNTIQNHIPVLYINTNLQRCFKTARISVVIPTDTRLLHLLPLLIPHYLRCCCYTTTTTTTTAAAVVVVVSLSHCV